MLKNLKETKKLIDPFLLDFLDEEEKNFENQELVKEAFFKIKDFVINGKTLRGSLFLLAAQSLDQTNYKKHENDLLQIAAALELIHSGLLIHDDIIDQDEKRRGRDSVWHQYKNDASKQNYKDPKNYGQSLAICLGSITLYLAHLSLEKIAFLPEEIQKNIRQIIDQEIIKTYFAEMLDSKITLQKEVPSSEEVLEMYLFKTARYTFSLPLKLACAVNNLDDSQTNNLIKIGENLGLIFQIKDDQIGLFATEEISGKSFASDIREGKKTIFYLYLIEKANNEEKQFLFENYGQKEIDLEKIKKIQELFKKYSLIEVEILINKLSKEAKILIENVEHKKTAELLTEILDFNLNREF
jgi:geranylgeranyl diphosphate synthase type I